MQWFKRWLRPPSSNLYAHLSRYNKFTCIHQQIQKQGNYAPISAYETKAGKIVGHLYMETPGTPSLSPAEVADVMIDEFESKMKDDELSSYAVYYHSDFPNSNSQSASRNRQRPHHFQLHVSK